MKNIGIYCIFFPKLDNKYYIGFSSNLRERIQAHLSALKTLRHTNYRLQEAYHEFGVPEVHILEYCPLELMREREIYWIKEFNSFKNGFNITNGGDGSGYGEGTVSALYTEKVYKNILNEIVYTNNTLLEISTKLNVSLHVVKHISCGATHSWLQELCPIEYKLLQEQLGTRDNSAKAKGIVYPKLLSPQGIEYIVENIHKFCREHELQAQNLHKVLTKQRPHHKKWRLVDEG